MVLDLAYLPFTKLKKQLLPASHMNTVYYPLKQNLHFCFTELQNIIRETLSYLNGSKGIDQSQGNTLMRKWDYSRWYIMSLLYSLLGNLWQYEIPPPLLK